jgi:cathepsin F
MLPLLLLPLLFTAVHAAAASIDFATADFGDGVITGPTDDRPFMRPTRRAIIHPPERLAAELPTDSLPTSFDWRDTPGVVSRVKDQGSVGSCWSFSTTGNLEGQVALAKNASVELSEEFLVDCDNLDCSVFGGYPHSAFEFIQKRGGIPSEADEPYCSGGLKGVPICYPCMADLNQTQCGQGPAFCNASYTASRCGAGKWVAAATISSWVAISQNETQIAAQLMARGPLSVLLDATMLQYYKKGGASSRSSFLEIAQSDGPD